MNGESTSKSTPKTNINKIVIRHPSELGSPFIKYSHSSSFFFKYSSSVISLHLE